MWPLGKVELRSTFSVLARALLGTEVSQPLRRETRRRRVPGQSRRICQKRNPEIHMLVIATESYDSDRLWTNFGETLSQVRQINTKKHTG